GTSIRVSDRVHLVGDWTGIVSGDNTLSTANATRKHKGIWGAALRMSSDGANGHFDLDLGYGNATGSTTGTSLTPGLGNASGFYMVFSSDGCNVTTTGQCLIYNGTGGPSFPGSGTTELQNFADINAPVTIIGDQATFAPTFRVANPTNNLTSTPSLGILVVPG